MIKIFFDMDGTIANLYQKRGWLESIMDEQEGLFQNLEPMFTRADWVSFEASLSRIFNGQYELGIITWTPMNVTSEYCQIVEQEKRNWVLENLPKCFTEFHALPFGVPKQYADTKRAETMILVDDNMEVLSIWESPKVRKGIVRTPNITLHDIFLQIVDIMEKKEFEKSEKNC